MGATLINSANLYMTSNSIKSIEDLCDYINESKEYPMNISNIIQKYKWIDLNGYNKHPEYICTDGAFLLLKSEDGVEIRTVDGDFIEDTLEEIMQSTDVSDCDCELRIFDELRKLKIHSNRVRFGNRIEELRVMKGLKQHELADVSGIDRTNVVKIENGRYNASFDILSKIAKALDSEVDIVTNEEYVYLENMRRQEEAKAIFAYYDGENRDVCVFGEWAVNECGDIVNYKKYYPLYNYDLNPYGYGEDKSLSYWYDHISEKYDYDVEHFVQAFRYAMKVIKENSKKKDYITKLGAFIIDNKDRDDIVGDLCNDLMRDKAFADFTKENEQKEYIIMVGHSHTHIQDSIVQLFKEYSGEEITFEEESFEV